MQAGRLFGMIALAAAALALAACAATRPAKEWRNDKIEATIDKVLVIAAFQRSTQRRVYEDEFFNALSARGVTAIPGYTLITSSAEITRESVEEAIRGRDIDAVLVTRLLGIEDVEVYEPPPMMAHHRRYYPYYSHAMTETGSGYYRRFKVLTLETNLYDTLTRELVWSMQSESMDPSAPRPVITEQIDLTIERLQAQGLLAE